MTTIAITINNAAPDVSALQDALSRLQEWTTAYDITINNSKTIVLIIESHLQVSP